MAADQQAGRVAVKQSSLTRTASIGHELATVTDSPHKPPVLTLDLSSQQPTAGSTESTAGAADTGSQQSQS